MKNVIIYTDGACSGNPGPGGWGAVLIYGENRKEISGFEKETTNNRMEITAAIEALSLLKLPCEVRLYTDSSYVANAVNKFWLVNWKRNDWIKKGDKSPVLNRDLWEKLDELNHIHKVTYIQVKGHADNEENNRCDKLATDAIKRGVKDGPQG